MSLKDALSRREFFLRFGRLGAFAALGWLSIRLARRVAPPGERCVNDFICRGCTVVANCGLPQALSFRRVIRGGGR
jgi:hypothetical protein